MFAANRLQPQPGRLLISEPFLHDDYFRRAVILIAEHNEKGTVGFILNKPLDITVAEAIPDFPEYEKPSFFGGPVQRDQLFFIHTLGEKVDGAFPIGGGLFWLGDFDQIKKMISERKISSSEIRFFIGYAGWEPGQLEKELKEKSWFVSKSDHQLIFNVDASSMWTEAVKKMGTAFAPMANFPEDPSMN